MNELESNLKEIIIDKYGSMKKFSEAIDMPWTTLDSILKRGVANSNISNVLKITKELEIDAEQLIDGKIVSTTNTVNKPITIAAHFDGTEYTEEQLDRIKEFAKFIKQENK